jgi:hypothetical protein
MASTVPCATHDPAPAKLLLELFAEDRTLYADLALGFSEAWRENVRITLDSVADVRERKAWARAFSATRQAWEAAYFARGSNRLTVLADLGDFTLHEDEGDAAWAA